MMRWRNLFQPPPRMIAARWIAESMMREPQEWACETSQWNDSKIYKRGNVSVQIGLYVVVNGERWEGKEGRIIRNAIQQRNALMVSLQLAEAHK